MIIFNYFLFIICTGAFFYILFKLLSLLLIPIYFEKAYYRISDIKKKEDGYVFIFENCLKKFESKKYNDPFISEMGKVVLVFFNKKTNKHFIFSIYDMGIHILLGFIKLFFLINVLQFNYLNGIKGREIDFNNIIINALFILIIIYFLIKIWYGGIYIYLLLRKGKKVLANVINCKEILDNEGLKTYIPVATFRDEKNESYTFEFYSNFYEKEKIPKNFRVIYYLDNPHIVERFSITLYLYLLFYFFIILIILFFLIFI